MCKDCGCGSTGNVTTKLFHVPGMMCGNCENTVNGAVRGLPGVLESTVDLKTKALTILKRMKQPFVQLSTKQVLKWNL